MSEREKNQRAKLQILAFVMATVGVCVPDASFAKVHNQITKSQATAPNYLGQKPKVQKIEAKTVEKKPDAQKEQRLNQAAQAASFAYPDNHVMRAISLAQALGEAGAALDSSVFKKTQNPFGIKAGRHYAHFKSMRHAFQRHHELMHTPPYAAVMAAAERGDLHSAIYELGKTGYELLPVV